MDEVRLRLLGWVGEVGFVPTGSIGNVFGRGTFHCGLSGVGVWLAISFLLLWIH